MLTAERLLVDVFEIGAIRRLPLGTDYNNVVAAVHALLARCPDGTELVVDGSGIGKPVVDMLTWRGLRPWSVTATAGISQSVDHAHRTASVPKLQLISRIQSLLFGGQLKVQADLPEAAAFLTELKDFRVEFTAAGNMVYDVRGGRGHHGDMVSAAAVAAWRLTDGQGGCWDTPTPLLAHIAAGIGHLYAGPYTRPWVIGVDLGKVNDPSCVVVMRKQQIERDFVPEPPPPPPEPTEPPPPEIRVPWRVRFDEMAQQATPSHPDVRYREMPVEHLNGEHCKPSYAIGSQEWLAEQSR